MVQWTLFSRCEQNLMNDIFVSFYANSQTEFKRNEIHSKSSIYIYIIHAWNENQKGSIDNGRHQKKTRTELKWINDISTKRRDEILVGYALFNLLDKRWHFSLFLSSAMHKAKKNSYTDRETQSEWHSFYLIKNGLAIHFILWSWMHSTKYNGQNDWMRQLKNNPFFSPVQPVFHWDYSGLGLGFYEKMYIWLEFFTKTATKIGLKRFKLKIGNHSLRWQCWAQN